MPDKKQEVHVTEEEEPVTFDKWDHRQVKNAIKSVKNGFNELLVFELSFFLNFDLFMFICETLFIDDTVKVVIKNQLGDDSEECFALVDKRLWMAFISCLLCGIACLYDYLYPYPQSHYFMIWCIVPYAIM